MGQSDCVSEPRLGCCLKRPWGHQLSIPDTRMARSASKSVPHATHRCKKALEVCVKNTLGHSSGPNSMLFQCFSQTLTLLAMGLTLCNYGHLTWKLASICETRRDKLGLQSRVRWSRAREEVGWQPSKRVIGGIPRRPTMSLLKLWDLHHEIMTLTLRNQWGQRLSLNASCRHLVD
jgi:hypothetical protein